MKRAAILLFLVIAGSPSLAVEIHLRDGSVVEAVEYTLTGSYLLLETADGRHVAYDIADVDLESLPPADGAEKTQDVPETDRGKLGVSAALILPEDEQVPEGLTITDRDVGHALPAGAEEAETGKARDDAAGDSRVGGGVEISRLLTVPLDAGRYRITVEVVNRTQETVQAVRATVSVSYPDRHPWTDQLSIAAVLAAGDTAELTSVVSLPPGPDEGWQPRFQVLPQWISAERLSNPESDVRPERSVAD